MVQAPRPNAGRREKSRENDLFFLGKKKLPKKNIFFFAYIFKLCQNIGGNKFSASGGKKERPEVCNKNGQLRIANVTLRIGGGAHFYYLFKEVFFRIASTNFNLRPPPPLKLMHNTLNAFNFNLDMHIAHGSFISNFDYLF